MENSKAKVLCVDDDPDLLLINSSILKLAGHEVLEATDGHACIDMIRKERKLDEETLLQYGKGSRPFPIAW